MTLVCRQERRTNLFIRHIFLFLRLCRAFETQMTHMEAEFVQREAPPSYGQLIAQGLIPPVEDFPVQNPTQVTCLVLCPADEQKWY